MASLLESFIVQQVAALISCTNTDFQLAYYRDKDGIEVDIVLTKGAKTWGIEVKASASLTNNDGRGLARLEQHCQNDFQGGIIIYTGTDILLIRHGRFFAVPVCKLWS